MPKSLAAYVNLYGNLKIRNRPDVVHRRPFTNANEHTHTHNQKENDRVEMEKTKA